MAPPSKLNAVMIERVVGHLRDGLHRCAVAALVHVDENTFTRWYHRGSRNEKGDAVYRKFFEAVNEAEAQYQHDALETLKGASPKNPKVVQWLLSRRFPQLYGRRDNVEAVSFEDHEQRTVALRELLLERLERLAPELDAPAAPALPPADALPALPAGAPEAPPPAGTSP